MDVRSGWSGSLDASVNDGSRRVSDPRGGPSSGEDRERGADGDGKGQGIGDAAHRLIPDRGSPRLSMEMDDGPCHRRWKIATVPARAEAAGKEVTEQVFRNRNAKRSRPTDAIDASRAIKE